MLLRDGFLRDFPLLVEAWNVYVCRFLTLSGSRDSGDCFVDMPSRDLKNLCLNVIVDLYETSEDFHP